MIVSIDDMFLAARLKTLTFENVSAEDLQEIYASKSIDVDSKAMLLNVLNRYSTTQANQNLEGKPNEDKFALSKGYQEYELQAVIKHILSYLDVKNKARTY